MPKLKPGAFISFSNPLPQVASNSSSSIIYNHLLAIGGFCNKNKKNIRIRDFIYYVKNKSFDTLLIIELFKSDI